MSRTAEELLEFDALRAILRGYTTCALGRHAIDALAPSQELAALESAFARIGEAIAYLRAGSEMGFGSLADPTDWLERLSSPAAVLAPQELLDAASLIETATGLRKEFREEKAKFPLLAASAESLADLRPLAVAVRRAVLPNGEISDDASSELKRIRTAMGRTRDKIHKTLRDILRARGEEPGADYITLRNDRFVIPIRASERRQVQGVVHGASATGQTVFVEPLETLDLNNQLVQFAEDEALEIARILRELTERLQGSLGPLQHIAATIAELDSVFARGRFARAFNCCLPVFVGSDASPEGAADNSPGRKPWGNAPSPSPSPSGAKEIRQTPSHLHLEAARHPVLEANLRKQERTVVPMSLAMGGEETVLVISGPNTGGKTVALKTVGLAALAAQSGIPVAAERAELPLFDRVLADIGDEQSITADLSTFSAHIGNLRAMLEAATPGSLVLVDEMGTGTAPEEGSALAVALLEEFGARRCLTLATTHHDRLKTYASTTAGVLNAAVEFDEVNLRPTYRLLVGVPGTSSGIAIAERLGLPAAVIARARAELAPEAREASDLIAWLHRSRDELEEIKRQATAQVAALEEERRRLQTEWAERQRKRLAELEQRFNAALQQYEEEVKKLVGEVKDRELRAQMEKQMARRVGKVRKEAREEADAAVVAHLSESQMDLGPAAMPIAEPAKPELLVPGARVRVRGLAQPVVIRQKDDRTAEVQAGPLRMKIQLSDIVAVVGEASPPARVAAGPQGPAQSGAASLGSARDKSSAPTMARGVTVHAQPSDEPATDEINVIGCNVEEATRRVDRFLDHAALAGQSRVRIIHGHGMGILRRALAELLAEHALVERFAVADPDHGGTAITIVELKS